MKLPISAAINVVKSVEKKHGPQVAEFIADKATKEIMKAIKKKIRERR